MSWLSAREVTRGQLQYLIKGEAAAAVSCRRVGGVAKQSPELSRGFVMTCSIRHPDSRPNRASDAVGRSEQGSSEFRVTCINSDCG